MDITKLPFNSFIGIQRSTQPEIGKLELEDLPQYHNHLRTVHAAAQFALAEACSGDYLLEHFGESAENHVSVVRRAEIKYRKPAMGKVFAKARISPEQGPEFIKELSRHGRAMIDIEVQVVDANENVTLNAVFVWYVQKMEEQRS